MEPDSRQAPHDAQPPGQVPEPSGPLLPSVSLGKSFQGMVYGALSTLYLHLLSLRVGLLGWYFCLKQVQWDILCWVHASMELATDLVFCWAQNVLLAFMMLLLLSWKVCSGVTLPGWHPLLRRVVRRLALNVQLAWALSLLKRAFWRLKCLVVWMAWAPAYCLAWVICCIARTLEISYKQAARLAKEEEELEEEKALVALIMREDKF
ncbi:transmembrane protein 270 [Sceloporus undulatus]|uniref:transmembrane protein 270 n=1 Tax=Sceloporus undulatus TaxID=8520 RepID=UPI001C4DBDEA|nr:transmembrane protein 270 [Sceloporus undulatus]XP_042298254.1 transmembrane protein 270 [Sceloporus undulatus]